MRLTINRDVLVRWREQHNVTQHHFAACLGLKHALVGHWETGHETPSRRQLVKLMALIGDPALLRGVEREQDDTAFVFDHAAFERNRIKRNVSRRQLAHVLETSQRTIQTWEEALCMPSPYSLSIINDRLGWECVYPVEKIANEWRDTRHASRQSVYGMDIPHAVLDDMIMDTIAVNGGDWSRTSFKNASIRHSSISFITWHGADLFNSTLYDTKMATSDMRTAIMPCMNIHHTTWSGVWIGNTAMHHTMISHTTFEYCVFVDVHLFQCALNNVIFKHCVFLNTAFQQNLFNQCTIHQCWNVNTLWDQNDMRETVCTFAERPTLLPSISITAS